MKPEDYTTRAERDVIDEAKQITVTTTLTLDERLDRAHEDASEGWRTETRGRGDHSEVIC